MDVGSAGAVTGLWILVDKINHTKGSKWMFRDVHNHQTQNIK